MKESPSKKCTKKIMKGRGKYLTYDYKLNTL